MRVAFRVDSGTAIGSGHVMRCLTLADALRHRGAAIRFVLRTHDGHLGALVRGRGFDVVELASAGTLTSDPSTWLGASLEDDAEATIAAVAGLEHVDWLVVDHYAVTAPWHRSLRKVAERILAIDDLADRLMDVDTVVDHNFGAEDKPYALRTPAASCHLLGPTFALLDPRFGVARAASSARSAPLAPHCRVLVSLGGSDPNNVTSYVLTHLARELAEVAAVDVVIGRGHPAAADVEAAVRRMKNARLHIQTTEMPELLSRADVAIGAGGVSLLERCCVGVPSVALALAENQEPALESLAAAGLHVYVRSGLTEPAALAKAFRCVVADGEWRARVASTCRGSVDGEGSERVADHMMGLSRNDGERGAFHV